jgi:hypothetical protein
VAKGCNILRLRSSLLESVSVTEFQASEAYSSADLTKAKYSISTLPTVEEKIVGVEIKPNNSILCENSN